MCTFFQYIKIDVSIGSQWSKSYGLKRRVCVQHDWLVWPVSLHPYPVPTILEEMNTRTGNKIKLSSDATILQLLECSLCTQVPCVRCLPGNPLKQPFIALVSTSYFKGNHEMSSKCNHGKLSSFTKKCHSSTHSYYPKSCSKIWVVLQRRNDSR